MCRQSLSLAVCHLLKSEQRLVQRVVEEKEPSKKKQSRQFTGQVYLLGTRTGSKRVLSVWGSEGLQDVPSCLRGAAGSRFLRLRQLLEDVSEGTTTTTQFCTEQALPKMKSATVKSHEHTLVHVEEDVTAAVAVSLHGRLLRARHVQVVVGQPRLFLHVEDVADVMTCREVTHGHRLFKSTDSRTRL